MRQMEERQKRVDERRRVAEAAERDKENQADLANLFYHEDSEEELIVLLDCGTQTESCLMVDNDAQTSQTEMTEATTHASLVPTTPTTPIVCCLPRAPSTATTLSSELLKDNDEVTKFYTGLPSQGGDTT